MYLQIIFALLRERKKLKKESAILAQHVEMLQDELNFLYSNKA